MSFTKPAGVVYGTPEVVLSTTAAAGSKQQAIRIDGQLIAFSGDTPEAVGSSAATGSDAVAARLDHVHVGAPNAGTTVDEAIARYSGTSGALQGYTSGGPTVSDTGVMLKTAQPAVLAYENATNTNITGAGTLADLSFNTEIFDQGSNFDNPTFTAPVTGRYLFIANTKMEGITTAMTRAGMWCVTSNRNWIWEGVSPTAVDDVYNNCAFSFSGIADLDASDTLKMQIVIYNGADDTADQAGAATLQSSLSICLLC